MKDVFIIKGNKLFSFIIHPVRSCVFFFSSSPLSEEILIASSSFCWNSKTNPRQNVKDYPLPCKLRWNATLFTLNRAPPVVIVRRVKLPNPRFVYTRSNVCCNKWAWISLIVSDYILGNTNIKQSAGLCGPSRRTAVYRSAAHLCVPHRYWNLFKKLFVI